MSTVDITKNFDDTANDTQNDADSSKEPSAKRQRAANREYITFKSFSSFTEAQELVQQGFDELKWAYHKATEATQSTDHKVYYKCSFNSCSVRLQLRLDSESLDTTILISDEQHIHEPVIKRIGISEKVKELISLYYKDGITLPGDILRKMHRENIEDQPTIKQLRNYLVQYKKKSFGTPSLSIPEVVELCKKHSTVPGIDEPNKVFVGKTFFLYGDEHPWPEPDLPGAKKKGPRPKMRILFTCRYLLEHVIRATHVAEDTTYKLTWQGFPVFMAGTTDANKSYHPFGLAICTEETHYDHKFFFTAIKEVTFNTLGFTFVPTILLADAAPEITNEFTEAYDEPVLRVVCWIHVLRNCKVHLKNNKSKNAIVVDIMQIQLSRTATIFHAATSLFLVKWEMHQEFCAYIKDQWFDHNSGWYEGYVPGIPSQDNALESTNLQVKHDTNRERLSVGKFFDIMIDKTVYFWGFRSNPLNTANPKPFAFSPTITLDTYTRAYWWLRSETSLKEKTICGIKYHFIPSSKSGSTILSSEFLQQYIESHSACNWETFDDFAKMEASVHRLIIDREDWMKSRCSCPFFHKNYNCKHIIGVCKRLKCQGVVIPDEAKSVEFGKKRGRGTPKHASRALIID